MNNIMIIIRPMIGVELFEMTDEEVQLEDIHSTIDADYLAIDRLTDEIELWVDDEGMVNGAANRLGAFSIFDADVERLGQVMYAGTAVLVRANQDDQSELSLGFSLERAKQIVTSLSFQGVANVF